MSDTARAYILATLFVAAVGGAGLFIGDLLFYSCKHGRYRDGVMCCWDYGSHANRECQTSPLPWQSWPSGRSGD